MKDVAERMQVQFLSGVTLVLTQMYYCIANTIKSVTVFYAVTTFLNCMEFYLLKINL